VIRILVKLLIIFALVFAAVSIWYSRVDENLRRDSVPKAQVVEAQPEKKTEILRKENDYTIIVRRNIFQAVVVKTEPVVEDIKPATLEPTKLKLSLMGTISGSDRDARAIISDEVKRKQDIYQVGDSVQGAMIKTIDRGKVVLSVNGKDEVLTLKDRQGGGAAYQPSPTDYFKEPAEPAELAKPVGTMESEGSKLNEKQSTSGRRQPTVRPRPVRRSLKQRSPGGED